MRITGDIEIFMYNGIIDVDGEPSRRLSPRV